MAAVIKLDITDYLAVAQAMTGEFGTNGRSVSKIEYYVNLIM